MRKLHVLTVLFGVLMTTAVSAQEAGQLKGFSVVLLLGETQGTVPVRDLSSSAKKALADIKEFLPYRGYKVLDTQWVAGSSWGTSKGRLRGLEEKEYEFELVALPSPVPEKPGVAHRALASARFIMMTPPIGYGPSGKFGATTILDNSFAIKPGETVVVGTSRAKGDSALIVLLTAVVSEK
jgi:hypothetical protein